MIRKNSVIGPYQIAFDITNKCNLRCLHCYNASGENTVLQHELSDDEVLSFIKSLLPLKLLNFCFCGGETLLRRNVIYEGIRLLRNSGIKASLVTNGILATEEVVRELYLSGLNNIQFSIDGINASSHDKLRNKQGVFSQVMAALDNARKYDMDISVAFSPTSFNITEIAELHSYLEGLTYNGRIEMRVQPLMPVGRGNKNAEVIEPTQTQYRQLVNTINTINRANNKVHIEWGDPIDHLLRYPEKKSLPCYYVSIRANGDIVASPYLPLVIGNIRDHSLEDYWNAGLYQIWSKKIPCYMASFINSIADMGSLQNEFPKTFFEDIHLDMIENDLDDLSLIKTYQKSNRR